MLVAGLHDGMRKISGVNIVSTEDINNNSGIVSINIRDHDSRMVASLLDRQFRIAVRGGIHCAPLAHETIRTGQQGCVRFSPGYYSSESQIDACIRAVTELSRTLR